MSDLDDVFELMRRAPENFFQTLRGTIRMQEGLGERLLKVWLEPPDRFRVESVLRHDLQARHDLQIRDGERWWSGYRSGSDSEWQSPKSSQEPMVASGIIDHECTRLFDPWPLLAEMLFRTAGACEPLGRAMVAGRESIRLRWTRPVGEKPVSSPTLGGWTLWTTPVVEEPVSSTLGGWASEVEVAVDAERGVLLRYATDDRPARRVEFVEVVFDEPHEPDTFRPSWTTSEGTSIYSDPRTGLLNYRYFQETLPRKVARAQDTDKPLALLVLDIDDFKQVNDKFGHVVGNAVLTEVVQCISAVVRPPDLLCRIGGDEFAVIFPEAGIDEAELFYTRLRDHITATPIEAVDHISLSCGIAELEGHENWETFFRRADDALYRAKRNRP